MEGAAHDNFWNHVIENKFDLKKNKSRPIAAGFLILIMPV